MSDKKHIAIDASEYLSERPHPKGEKPSPEQTQKLCLLATLSKLKQGMVEDGLNDTPWRARICGKYPDAPYLLIQIEEEPDDSVAELAIQVLLMLKLKKVLEDQDFIVDFKGGKDISPHLTVTANLSLEVVEDKHGELVVAATVLGPKDAPPTGETIH